MRVSPDLLQATKSRESDAHGMINIWSHSAYAHYPGNPGPGFWVIGGNLRLMQRQKPGVLHADFAACDGYKTGFERGAQVKCPALFLLGARDAMTPARAGRDLARAVPNSVVKTLEGAGHNLMGEKPDEVLDVLLEFLRA
jgi:pimeloyl-ACP methyl ester carboxylesterase